MKMKPCPFCGSEVNYYDDCFESRDTSKVHKIKCNKCGAEIGRCISPYQPDYEQEVKALFRLWNKRVKNGG